jgi:hypothetical protein
VALEIRKPGTTYRAWDNVRFSASRRRRRRRNRGAESAAHAAEEFVVARTSVAGRPGVAVSVDSDEYRLEHLTPSRSSHRCCRGEPHNLHALSAPYRSTRATARSSADSQAATRRSCRSASARIGVVADTEPAEVLKVSVPDAA